MMKNIYLVQIDMPNKVPGKVAVVLKQERDEFSSYDDELLLKFLVKTNQNYLSKS